MHLFEGTSPSNNISRKDIKESDVFVYEEKWYHRNSITNKIFGDRKYMGMLKAREYEGDVMNPPSTILYVENDKGEKVGDFEDIVQNDKDSEISVAGTNLLVDVVSDMSLVNAFKNVKTLKEAVKVLATESVGVQDAKNLEKGKSLLDTLLDSTPFVGTKRSLDNLFNAGKNNVKNQELTDRVKENSGD